jgi:acetyl esterase/lipase
VPADPADPADLVDLVDLADPRAVLSRPAPPPDATVRYGRHPDQVADVRLPDALDPTRPLVVVVHGGFWRAEYDRHHTGPLAADLADRGWPVAQLEYRRTGQDGGGWPGTFADLAAGLALLPALVADLASAVAGPPLLLGHSAGGHLALWWAGLAGPAAVRGVVALAPVVGLTAAHRLDLDDGAVAALLGGGPQQVPHRYAYAEPRRPHVPTVVIHGTKDRQVPVTLSRDWTAGGHAELVELPDAEHFAVIDPHSAAWPAVVRSLERLATQSPR